MSSATELTETEIPDIAEVPRARTVVPHIGATTPSAMGVIYRTEPQVPRRPKPATVDPLEAANRAIARITDERDLSPVERSNLFDDWKEALTRAAETGLARSAHQRQVVGALLSSTRKKDVVDFEAQQLMALRTTTNIARANPVALDVSRAIHTLTENNLLRPLALSPDGLSEADEVRLRAIMERLGAE